MKTQTPWILLVEDNEGDALLMMEALKESSIKKEVATVTDGVEALDFLHRKGQYAKARRPNLIFLDLNLPRKNGCEVLVEIKQDPKLRQIPVIILSTSSSPWDIDKSYELHANCYITKPMDFEEFMASIKDAVEFWFKTVTLIERDED